LSDQGEAGSPIDSNQVPASEQNGQPTASHPSRPNAHKSESSKDQSHPATEEKGQSDEDDESEDETDAELMPETQRTPLQDRDPDPTASLETTARLDAMQQERDNLRVEVANLRKSLESLQEKHNEDTSTLREELEESQQGKEHAETQYRNLLGKVNTIRSQLGDRLKADAAELDQKREQIEELETVQNTIKDENMQLQQSIAQLTTQLQTQAAEVEALRSRTNVSTSNWAKERDELNSREAYLREEYEMAKQAMQDWEILATEERSRRETLEENVQGLEEQLRSQREAHERVRAEADIQNNTVDGLQRALQELQEERKRELREIVEKSEQDLDALRGQLSTSEDQSRDMQTQLDSSRQELERTLPFEKEVKEKNLLIGKLRHEAVILNDHLTKALRFLKRGKPEDNVDRQLVTNHFLHFLQLDRSDPKKFQILQLIAALLGWDEQQREQAGLLRQGTGVASAGGSLRVPVSPFRRTPSTPTLGNDFIPDSPSVASRESLAELWSEFLEREAEAGSTAPSSSHRAGTVRGGGRTPSIGGAFNPTREKE